MNSAFYWIGVGVVGTVLATLVAVALFALYGMFLHGRFQLILFRKTERRLSLAAWYNARLMNDTGFHADDFPIGQRPFLLAYRFRGRSIFVMFGMLGARRNMPILGQHPEYPA